MKRYYVTHCSGMTTDSEFVEIRDRLLDEGLIDPDSGRNERRVRWSDGRTTDKQFLHLWADRGDAEAFLSLLKRDENDRRWKVFVVDVEGTIEEILEPTNLRLPIPPIIAVRNERFTDVDGEDALQIWVILDDVTPEDQRTWAKVEPIHRKIVDTLASEGIPARPYIWFRTEAEFATRRKVS